MGKNDEYWLQDAFEGKKEGALHRMLGVPPSVTLPITWLEVIKKTKIGSRAWNPTQIGFKSVKVTRLLKQRAVAALNARRIGQKRYGK